MASSEGRQTDAVLKFLIVLLFIGGAGILLYPTFSDLWNRYRTAKLTTSYTETVGGADAENQEALEAARAYNRAHTVNTIADAFSGEEKEEGTGQYESLLDPMGNGMMGYLEIPEIGQKLAVYHGTDAETLEKGVGHVEGTSLPVGGVSTHAVLSAHRGLPSAKLFTDLDQMKKGDRFYLRILDETLAYEVDQILVVKPTETEALAIEQGKDLVTLVTCTPYGINTKRLLVRGHRIPYSPEEKQADGVGRIRLPSNRAERLFLLAVAGLVLLAVTLAVRSGRRRRRERMRETKAGSRASAPEEKQTEPEPQGLRERTGSPEESASRPDGSDPSEDGRE